MNRESAAHDLGSINPRIRLDAARFFAENAKTDDRELLIAALNSEDVIWIQNSLTVALEHIARDTDDQPQPELEADETDFENAAFRAEARVQITGQLLHELEPLIGVLKVRLGSEWDGYIPSKSNETLGRIESFLEALRELNSASHVPTTEEVHLSRAMKEIVDELDHPLSDIVAFAGPDITVLSNRTFLQLIVRNGIRNALDVSSFENGDSVVVTWGPTSSGGFFISVVDRGPGPPPGAERYAFILGRSSKSGHLGMGLAIAKQATDALGGTLSLKQGAAGGAVLEFRTFGTR